jgi:hypothetical protein
LSRAEDELITHRAIAPRKARMLAIVGGLFLAHAALLFLFWPQRWPASYKWLLLPDSVSAYLLLAFGIQQSRAEEDK